ncbi:MAG TPA: M23 family metallopeptidase [Fibrobacteria bacterium]|nr:M23 family metallopeptidase [Fibrobacteria bacterium]
MTRQISIRIGELGKAHSVELNKAGSWLVGVFILGAIALGLGAWQVLASARIYPKLLYQKQKNSLLQERLARLRKESGSVQIEVATLDSARRLISSRFGQSDSVTTKTSRRWSNARTLDALFPDPSGEEAWARSMEDLGEHAALVRDGLSRHVDAAKRIVGRLETTPSISPARGQVSSGFGWRLHPVLGVFMMHSGQDITGQTGLPVFATARGKVVTREFSSSFGNYVVLDHGNGIRTLYAHLSAFRCELGKEVRRGEEIGLMGSTGRSTGPHVHYEIHQSLKPLDPLPWILPTILVP